DGLEELKTSMFNLLRQTPTTGEPGSGTYPEELPVIRPLIAEDHRVLELEEDGVFRIVHQKAVRLAKGSNLELQEARIQYHKRLDQLKVTKALVDAGIEAGDTLLVGDWEFEWD
ncbi:MAG: Obg family GTPase CgtA, partial [Dehalococcoidia bacterium]